MLENSSNLYYVYYTIEKILEVLGMVLPLLIAVAYLTLLERKVLASVQRRRGPNVVGVFGLLQPLADGVKLFTKETILPKKANRVLFLIAPIITFALSLVTWGVIPVDESFVYADINVAILYLFAISSLGVYGILISGWASNSKYAFLGGMRSAAQMVSYEISMGFVFCTIMICAGSANLYDIVLAQEHIWYIVPLYPLWAVFFTTGLAETNRPPFDLPEAEAELVAGYNVEYSAMGFALFFLGESANILLMSGMSVILFFGGWLPPLSPDNPLFFLISWVPGFIWFGLKLALVTFTFIWVRAAFPRFRYDQLMQLGWKYFLPFNFAFFILVASILILFDWLP